MSDVQAPVRPNDPGIPTGPRPNESILNPNDASRMQAQGRIRPDMTVREALQVMGIDVDQPISQVPQLQQQIQNASLPGKINNTPSQPPQAGGMESLMQGLQR